MNKRVVSIAVIIVFAACGGAWAVSFGQLKQRARTQQGEFWRDVRDIVVKMTSVHEAAEKDGTPLKMTMTSYRQKDSSRADMENRGFKNTVITKGKEYWTISKHGIFKGVRVDKENDKLYDWYSWLGNDAQITGEETIDSRPCYRIEAHDPGHIVAWIDKKSLLPREVAYTRENTKIRYMNFRAIKGAWEFPYMIVVYKNNIKLSEQIVDSVAINQGINDATFDYRAVASREYKLKENAPVNAMPDMSGLRSAMDNAGSSADMPDGQKQKIQEMLQKMKQSQPAE